MSPEQISRAAARQSPRGRLVLRLPPIRAAERTAGRSMPRRCQTPSSQSSNVTRTGARCPLQPRPPCVLWYSSACRRTCLAPAAPYRGRAHRTRRGARRDRLCGRTSRPSTVTRSAAGGPWLVGSRPWSSSCCARLDRTHVAASVASASDRGDSSSVPVTLAVLPFHVLGDSPAEGELGLGLADDIITHLINVGEFRVRPTQSVLRVTGTDPDLQEAGHALNVDRLLTGTIRKHRPASVSPFSSCASRTGLLTGE